MRTAARQPRRFPLAGHIFAKMHAIAAVTVAQYLAPACPSVPFPWHCEDPRPHRLGSALDSSGPPSGSQVLAGSVRKFDEWTTAEVACPPGAPPHPPGPDQV